MTLAAGANKDDRELRVRFCPKGHDKSLPRGRGKRGSCRLCDNARATARTKAAREKRKAAGLTAVPYEWQPKQVAARAGGFKYAFHLPAEPLNRVVQDYLKRQGPISDTTAHGHKTFRSPLHALARAYAARFGGSYESSLRFISRLPEQTRVTIDQADRMAILLGLHPAMIWPREWGESA